ncbi:MAG TPA: hypothetical protein VKP08_22245 [Anaerolineales bacterium]|nr:hypothetical protein [Anaerolineales bacterium]
MKRFLHIALILLIMIVILSANPSSALASEGDDEHALEVEVNGYHVTLDSQNDWKKGENTIVVTLMDSMGMPVQNADVEILIAAKSDELAEPETEPAHEAEQGHSSMPGMDMGDHVVEASDMSAHGEEMAKPISLSESEGGIYVIKTHLESSGPYEMSVMFHVNGEMLQADFVVDILEVLAKAIVLWGFVAINVVLIASAGILKKQTIPVKGRQ